MASFDYTIQCDSADVNQTEAFRDMMTTQQTCFNRIAGENRMLQDKVEDLQQQNAKLVEILNQLKAENNQLQTGGQGGGSYAGGGTYGGGGAYGNAGGYDDGGGYTPAYGSNLGYAASSPDNKFMLERRFKIHDAPVHSVTMGPQCDIVATASWDATVKLYDLARQEVVQTLGDVEANEEGKMGGLYAVAFSKTMPEYLGCTSADKAVYLWNCQTGNISSKLLGHNDEVNGIDFHSVQTVMASASDDCKCIIWDFQEGITLRQLDKHTKAVYGCVFLGTENQYLLATCCFDQKTRIFDMRDKMIVAMLQRHSDDVIGIDFAPSRNILATGSDDGCIGIWDARTWKLQQIINTREAPGLMDNEVKRVAFSPDGAFLAAACSSQNVLVYDITATGKLVARLEGHQDCVFDVAWGTDPQTGAKLLVSASHDHTCQYWRQID